MCEKWIAPPYCDYFDSSRVDKHRLDCEKAMCAEKPWQVSLRHVQIFWWLKGTQIRIMYYIAIFKQLALGALKSLLFKDAPPSPPLPLSLSLCTVITQICAFRKRFLIKARNHGLNTHSTTYCKCFRDYLTSKSFKFAKNGTFCRFNLRRLIFFNGTFGFYVVGGWEYTLYSFKPITMVIAGWVVALLSEMCLTPQHLSGLDRSNP